MVKADCFEHESLDKVVQVGFCGSQSPQIIIICKSMYQNLTLCFIFLLEYNCFTLLHQFLLYNEVNQLYEYIYIYIYPLLDFPLPPYSPSPPSRSLQSTELLFPGSYIFLFIGLLHFSGAYILESS